MKRLSWVLGSLLLLPACGATPLEPKFAPSAELSEHAVAERISRAEARSERPVAVGITTDPARLCAWDLTGGLLWERPVEAKSAPLVAGDAVVLQEGAAIVVRDLASGEARVSLDAGGQLVGADAVGSSLVITIAHPNGTPRGTVAFVEGKQVRWQKTLPQPVGLPALVQGHVLLPWGTQKLTVLARADGTELARWDFHNLVLGQAFVDRGNVYIGQHGYLRVAGDLPDHRDGKLALSAPQKRPLPGQPNLSRDGYAPVPAPDSAEHKVKLEWRPAAAATAGVDDELVLFRFYKLLFGFEAQKDELRWVRQFERDIIGAAKQPGGVIVADEGGSLRFVDTQGNTRLLRELGKPLRVLTLRPGSFLSTGDVSAKELAAAPLESPAGTLHDQLLAVAQLEDNRLAPGRALAVQHLARTGAPSVTRELIALCTPKSVANDAGQLAACDELAKRESGSIDVLEALRGRTSWLDGTTPPPVGALAQAAARMRLKQAGPLLLSRAEDPHTAANDLVQVFLALQALEYKQAVPQLERFVRLHHAEPAGSELAPALQAGLLALGALHGTKVRPTVADIADDALTLPAVRQTAQEVLVALDSPIPLKPVEAKPEPAKADSKAASKVVVKDVVVEEVILTDPRRYALAADDAQKAFRPLEAALVRCLEADPGKPKSARISMIVSGQGKVEGALVTPTTLQGCAEPILRNAQFPSTRLGRQHLVHTVQAGKPQPAATEPPAVGETAKKPAPKPGAAKKAAPKQAAPK